MEADQLLSRADIKQLTGLSDAAITRALKAGHLPRPTGKRWETRWTQVQVDQWLAYRRRPRIAKSLDELTRYQAAKKLGISLTEFHRLARLGQMPAPCRKVGIRPIYSSDAIAACIAHSPIDATLTMREGAAACSCGISNLVRSAEKEKKKKKK